MSTIAPAEKALLAAPKTPKPPAADTLVRIARDFGVSPFKQLREMLTLRRGPGKLSAQEYVSTGAFRPTFDAEAKKEFVGREGSYLLNIGPNDHSLTVSRGFVRDKILYTQLLRSLGLPATQTQALVHTARHVGDLPTLRNPQDVMAFLLTRAKYPLFCKPVEGSGSVGSILILSVDAKTGMLRLGNGRDLDMDAFAHEVIADYPEGFIVQSAIQQHDVMRSVTGDAVGTLRVVTTRDETGIKPLYTLWKIPSPTAMSDNYWQDGSMIAEVDDLGQIVGCAHGAGPGYKKIEAHPVSGVTFSGLQVPHWDRLLEVAVQAHGVFPEFGIIGWDIGMSTQGPVIIEANDNPFHALYQLAADKGVRNPTLLPRLEAAAAETKRQLQDRIKTHNSRQAAKKA
ncbi:MAG: sugar-transfer associated ATP-grasp domain-containing protein [Aliishimia sp.]